MALQKRDPETGKFISRDEFYNKYPNGLTDEEYLLIRNKVRLEKMEAKKSEAEAADVIAENDPEGIPTRGEMPDDSLFGDMYEAPSDEDYAIRGCLAGVTVVLLLLTLALTTLFAIFGN